MTNVNFMKIKVAVKKGKSYKFYSASLSKAKLFKLTVKIKFAAGIQHYSEIE